MRTRLNTCAHTQKQRLLRALGAVTPRVLNGSAVEALVGVLVGAALLLLALPAHLPVDAEQNVLQTANMHPEYGTGPPTPWLFPAFTAGAVITIYLW